MGSTLAVLAAALILGGALGKSAQLPLQTWLPDAMAGPTPVSALIHAATMVTAGVYLIARMHVMFTLAPVVQTAVAVIGTLTLLIAGFSALAQSDIKRVLAYSTISQIGYMFLALGVGAWSAAMFHFFTHAFFKSLLFLGAGSVILAAHHEQNMYKLGGLRTQLPVTFWTFLVGAASLAAIPVDYQRILQQGPHSLARVVVSHREPVAVGRGNRRSGTYRLVLVSHGVPHLFRSAQDRQLEPPARIADHDSAGGSGGALGGDGFHRAAAFPWTMCSGSPRSSTPRCPRPKSGRTRSTSKPYCRSWLLWVASVVCAWRTSCS